MEADKPPQFEIHLFPRLEATGRFIAGLFSMRQLSEVSEHFQRPFEEPIEPVTHLPNQYEP